MALTEEAVRDLAIENAEVVRVTDMQKIMGYGVMSTPGLVIDGKVSPAAAYPRRLRSHP
jgi:hypothetical protein